VSDTSKVVLRTRSLARRFGSVRAVRSVDMEICEGEIYAFLGRNGAGKTTTLNMLMGILRPDDGAIEFFETSNGKRRASVSNEIKQRIGFVSQEQNFYPWMTCQQLGNFVGAFFPTWDSGEFQRLCQIFELPRKRKISALSGGMRVKLALVLALSHRPDMLILDEPTAGLDPVARRELLDAIVTQAQRSRRTTLFSTHRIDEAEQIAHRIGILHQGAMSFQGSLQELTSVVREVVIPRESPRPALPADIQLLQERVRGEHRQLTLLAAAERWQAPDFPFAESTPLSLEDIFVALTRGGFESL